MYNVRFVNVLAITTDCKHEVHKLSHYMLNWLDTHNLMYFICKQKICYMPKFSAFTSHLQCFESFT